MRRRLVPLFESNPSDSVCPSTAPFSIILARAQERQASEWISYRQTKGEVNYGSYLYANDPSWSTCWNLARV